MCTPLTTCAYETSLSPSSACCHSFSKDTKVPVISVLIAWHLLCLCLEVSVWIFMNILIYIMLLHVTTTLISHYLRLAYLSITCIQLHIAMCQLYCCVVSCPVFIQPDLSSQLSKSFYAHCSQLSQAKLLTPGFKIWKALALGHAYCRNNAPSTMVSGDQQLILAALLLSAYCVSKLYATYIER